MIRRAGPADLDKTWDIYRDAILKGTAPHYTAEEAHAWAGPPARPDWWADRMAVATIWLHEGPRGADGFISLAPPAHLDFFFVRLDARGSGVAAELYDCFVAAAQSAGHGQMTTYASHLARRFLEARGWVVTERQVVPRDGVPLVRFSMSCVPGAQADGNHVS